MLGLHRRTIRLLALLVILGGVIYVGRGLLHRDPVDADPTTSDQTEYAGKLRFLAVGDSYTIGEGVPRADRWPVQLAAQIRHAGIDLSDPVIIARTGWTTGNLLDAMDAADLHGTFDLVTLMIGVNNQYQGRGEDEYRQQFVALLERSIKLAGGKPGHVVVLSIPDWGVTPFAKQRDAKQIATAIDAFNRINVEETRRAGARYVDVTSSSRRAATQPTWFADDGLHPTGLQYADWITAVIGPAKDAIGESTPSAGQKK